ncbi:MAG: FKBP-type peptidyl-prolyl cis-trans isomerase [Bacteroidales bacterium]|nr:FKBP-type peptidyl-prolyl cis-trans isomerase [Bacteroidales bacterium]
MQHKIYILLAIVLFLGTTYSCQKESQDEIDRKDIENYISNNGIDATRHASGIYYKIIKKGSSTHPNVSSQINVDYKGTLLDGTSFDSAKKVSFNLGSTIVGWQVGIPLIGEGGEILLIIPSGLGYGNTAQGSVPKNSVMVFEVKLHFVS